MVSKEVRKVKVFGLTMMALWPQSKTLIGKKRKSKRVKRLLIFYISPGVLVEELHLRMYLLSLNIFVESKRMTSVCETSYDTCVVAAISVTSTSYKAVPCSPGLSHCTNLKSNNNQSCRNPEQRKRVKTLLFFHKRHRCDST